MDKTDQPGQVSTVEEIRDQVAELKVSVAVLAAQHAHILEAVSRIEKAVQIQSLASDDYRKTLMAEVLRTTDLVKTVETDLIRVKHDIERIAEITPARWLRRNAAVIAVTITTIAALAGAIGWIRLHFK